jgi:hypothetical protein
MQSFMESLPAGDDVFGAGQAVHVPASSYVPAAQAVHVPALSA